MAAPRVEGRGPSVESRAASAFRLDVAIALALFALHLILYARTVPPGLAYTIDPLNPRGDTHEFTMAIAELRLARRTGYPLYTWLGFLFTRAFPFGELAYRVNLMSAVFGAAGVATIFAVARCLALRRPFAVVAAVALGVSTTFWSQAVIAEVYTLNILALGIVILALLRWAEQRSTASFAIVALAYGVALGCHTSNLALAVAFAAFVLATDRAILRNWRALTAAFLAFSVGISQYAWLPLMADSAQFPNPRPDSIAGFYSYTIGAFSNLRFAYQVHELPQRFLVFAGLLEDNFSWLGIALGVVGAWEIWRRQPVATLLIGGVFAVNVFVAMQVFATDAEVFFLPSYVSWSVLIGFGASAVWAAVPRFIAPTGGRHGIAASWTVRLILVAVLGGWLAHMAQTSWAENDHSDDTIFEDFYSTVFSILPPRSYLVPGPGVFGQGALYFQRVLGWRPDVTIHASPDRMQMPPEPVYAVLPLVNGYARPPFSGAPFPRKAWLIPVVVTGNEPTLTLYRIDRFPPRLVRKSDDFPRRTPGAPPRLFGVRVEAADGAPRQRLRVGLEWIVDPARLYLVVTRVDGAVIDRRRLGLGNLGRYMREVESISDGDELLLEEYELLLPASVVPGRHSVEFGIIEAVSSGAPEIRFDAIEFSID